MAILTPEPMQTTHVGVGTATLQRMIIDIDYGMSGSPTNTVEQEMFLGVAVVTRDARVGGIVPTPASNFNQDWYYWTRMMHKQFTLDGPPFTSRSADIRSRRRLRGGYDLILVLENVTQQLATVLNVSMRLLWSQEA